MHILVLSLSFKGQLEKQAAVTLDVLLRAGADLQPLAVNASYVVTLALSLASGGPTGHREGTEHITLIAFERSICAEGGRQLLTRALHNIFQSCVGK